MRRADREVTDKARIAEIMAACDVCRLAFADGEVPYVLPLNFGMAEAEGALELYFHGATEGEKYRLMADGRPAAFEMDCNHELVTHPERGYCTMMYESVVGRGVLREIGNPAEKIRALQLICNHYHPEGFAFSEAAVPRTRVFKLVVESLTAKVKQ